MSDTCERCGRPRGAYETLSECARTGGSECRSFCAGMRAGLERAKEETDERLRYYPEGAFPTPDMKAARVALAAAGMTLDSVSADNFRWMLKSLGEMYAALAAEVSGE